MNWEIIQYILPFQSWVLTILYTIYFSISHNFIPQLFPLPPLSPHLSLSLSPPPLSFYIANH